MDVVTFGETMVLFSPLSTGPLRYATHFEKTIGGAESNVAIALVRLGHTVRWISRLGDDEFGTFTRNFIRGEGVDTSAVTFDHRHPTAVYFKERREGREPNVYYYRSGSAASQMKPEHIREEQIRDAHILHLTGITPALSDGCKETVHHSISLAQKHNLTIVFDPNIRLKLWTKAEARETLMEIAAKCDVVMPGLEEGTILTRETEPEKIGRVLLKNGAKVVVIKLGAKGAYYQTADDAGYVAGFPVDQIVDSIGAGDGFAAGFLSGYLRGWPLGEAVRLGNRIGAYALTVAGDVEGYPFWSQMNLDGDRPDVSR
ncbi:sugar kinase [Brevibacillus humidisoli]|nr:sugar kinase [Brevibacillus humidisoli]